MATAAGIMILVAAVLLIHILKKAVTPINPAILLHTIDGEIKDRENKHEPSDG